MTAPHGGPDAAAREGGQQAWARLDSGVASKKLHVPTAPRALCTRVGVHAAHLLANTLEMQCLCVRQLAGTGVAVSIAYPGMTSTAMTADWGAAGRTAAAMLVAWRSEAHATVTQARPARFARSRAHGRALWPIL